MKKTLWFTKFGVLSLAAVTVLTACGTAEATEETATTDNPDAETIVVGTGNAYQPFVYLDENNELQGYDIEVLKAVDEKLDQYTFEYEATDFKNVLTSLSADKVDLAAHQYEYNDERAAKYLYGEVGYTDYTLFIVTSGGKENFATLDDLQGKKVYAPQGSNVAYLLEQYNTAHTDEAQQIEIIYGEGSGEIFVSGLENGTYDAGLITKYDQDKYNKQFDAGIVLSTEPINVSKTFFLYNKGDDELKEAVDGALQELIDEGTLSEISTEVLGNDYTK
ncbi:L-cystine-binding protein TcyK [Aerococcus agrisoli]|uniref:L-cystine-binding protein TcyK n=1 Tax=Aerococcus agrisoli TaxID=2487350 RepID=A0A3N4GGD3_9LACT|nr:transporter substrate-binding domain-containing protein [Aerococcus agrisoli]RPA60898.1 L-cystine-binding protein TcyK [Aerococcus agrisoli]